MVLRTSLEEGGEIWNCNERFQRHYSFDQLRAFLDTLLKACNEVVCGDMEMQTLTVREKEPKGTHTDVR